MTDSPDSYIKDRLRLVLLLDACEAANLTPIPIMRFHALAFLANVLSPVWSLASYDGKILKRERGPFYPELQTELDRMVGLSLVEISDLGYKQEENLKWRVEGSFALNSNFTNELIHTAIQFSSERRVHSFLRRLAIAASQLDTPLEQVVSFDATWSDTRTSTGDVIDFSEWKTANYSAYAVSTFQQSLPKDLTITRGDMLQTYMRYLERRLYA